MYLRRLVAVLLCFIVLAGFSGQVSATSNNKMAGGISPQMTYIANSNCNISISSTGQASVESYVLGNSGIVTKVEIKMELQYYINGRWSARNTWTASSSSNYASLGKSTQVSKGYLYRTVATVTAYKGSDSETQVITSSETRY